MSSRRDADIQLDSEISANSQRQRRPAATDTPCASGTMTSRLCSSILAHVQRARLNLSEYPRTFSTMQVKRRPRGSRRWRDVGRGAPRAIRWQSFHPHHSIELLARSVPYGHHLEILLPATGMSSGECLSGV